MNNVISFPAQVVQFEVGKTYFTRFACDSDTVISYTVISRTDKSLRLKDEHGEVKTRRVKVSFGVEIARLASYSMAPTLSADRIRAQAF